MQTISEATKTEWPQALELLLAHWPNPPRAERISQLLRSLAAGELDPSGLLIARQQGEITGVLFLDRGIGNTATIGTPRTLLADSQLQVRLLHAGRERLQHWQIAFAQASLAPGEFQYGPIFEQADIPYLTQLEFYRQSLATVPKIDLPESVRFDLVQPTEQEEFIQLLFATYDKTQDCPELNGIRSEADVLQEYQCNNYLPARWWFVRSRGERVGVLLLSPGGMSNCELSYLGLLTSARGQGLGRIAVGFARQQAALFAKSLFLSVDERNRPARQLYLQEGFGLYQLRRIYWWHSSSPAG